MLLHAFENCSHRRRDYNPRMVRNVIVIGAGAVGVVLGGALARAAWNVTVVDVNEAKLEAGRWRKACLR
jgi:2-polyprenyl-6-methoxyphenol hydroxylase-like FAD-dependent oxidoreductase